ncbi:hypothetical protein ACIGXM_04765 [Kitasatospora sp. NPDC052896]|uniref:hypothetical protein n=1 Tax=Kitasatospora sp. NPDC052896 TaxID=3364061 RepID=UPI0037CC6DB2
MTHQTPEPVESARSASHPSLDQLADLQEELLTAAEERSVRAHVAGCPECAETLTALAGVSELLAAEPAPALPAEVADRIDAALAAEAATAPARPSAATPTRPHAPAGPAGHARPPGRADRSAGPARSPRRRRLLAAAAGTFAALGLGAGLLLSGVLGQQQPSTTAGAPARPTPAVAAGPAFTAAQLPAEVQHLLAGGESAAAQPPGNVPHLATEQVPSASSAALAPCVQQAVGVHRAEQPLASTHGSYDGSPVDLYVFRIAGDPSHLDVYLLSPDCAQHPGTTASVALHQVVPAG